MLPRHESPLRAGRSGFVAAFLSLLFPGLGHVYLGAYRRGLGFAAPPILLGALIAGVFVRMNAFDLAGMVIQTWFLTGLFIANLIALAYRAAAIVDSWVIAQAMGRGLALPRTPQAGAAAMVSVAGLAAVLLVMSLAHVAVARYDLLVSGSLSCVFGGNGTNCASPDESGAPGESGAPSGSNGPSAEPSVSIGPEASASALPAWNGTDRLNILLIGADEQEGAHNTDSMIVVSIDPKSDQVVMFSLPRDMVDIPLPAGPVQQAYGSTYGGKINSLWSAVHRHTDWFPNISVDGQKIANGPGYSGLMQTLGNLYFQDPNAIRYFVEVNFRGFKEVVDDLGGVTIDVETPVLDDNYPLAFDHRDRLYIPTGPQHMDGDQALQYARSRHGSSDFDRGARQQRVLVALRRAANIEALLPKVNDLLGALSQNVRTNIPREIVPQLMSLATKIDPGAVRSVIFTPPFYGTENPNDPRGYVIEPNVFRIRQAVKQAFTIDPNFQQAHDALASEGAQVWILNGSGQSGEGATVAAYLNYLGIAATAPNQRPATSPATTVIKAYNGAADQDPLTAQALAKVFGVQVVAVTDATVHVDFIVTTARSTPELTPPPQP